MRSGEQEGMRLERNSPGLRIKAPSQRLVPRKTCLWALEDGHQIDTSQGQTEPGGAAGVCMYSANSTQMDNLCLHTPRQRQPKPSQISPGIWKALIGDLTSCPKQLTNGPGSVLLSLTKQVQALSKMSLFK